MCPATQILLSCANTLGKNILVKNPLEFSNHVSAHFLSKLIIAHMVFVYIRSLLIACSFYFMSRIDMAIALMRPPCHQNIEKIYSP